MVFSTKKPKIIVVNQAAPSSADRLSGGANIPTKKNEAMGAPMKIQGRRRPQRVFVRSEIQPISGSVIASKARASVCASAMKPSATPTVSE